MLFTKIGGVVGGKAGGTAGTSVIPIIGPLGLVGIPLWVPGSISDASITKASIDAVVNTERLTKSVKTSDQ